MSAEPASNGVFVVIPSGNASSLRPPPAILHTSMCQPPGIMQFEEPPLGAQTPRTTQPPDLRPVEAFLTGEPKALGTVQILIGLIHLGFGSVLLLVRRGHLGMLFIEGGVPFWGGACFIISGSLSVAAERNHSSCLVSLNRSGAAWGPIFSAPWQPLWGQPFCSWILVSLTGMWAGAIWPCSPSSPSWSSSSQSLPPTLGAKPPAPKPTHL
ncbi:membrane-spanning 4-domains subfamily A member 15 isoform X2 [Choloepus didactylus]|uniref:membrane-spanning 4-domains subfamily A member 15 isoform X2 n=1 Tax=Choloepus didactylus TaxID=27675 RepID=UPI00189E5593|nr:membrane-spanning 4-domains subfamily A member 15 isoform X2 [Choloepus didactylus]